MVFESEYTGLTDDFHNAGDAIYGMRFARGASRTLPHQEQTDPAISWQLHFEHVNYCGNGFNTSGRSFYWYGQECMLCNMSV